MSGDIRVPADLIDQANEAMSESAEVLRAGAAAMADLRVQLETSRAEIDRLHDQIEDLQGDRYITACALRALEMLETDADLILLGTPGHPILPDGSGLQSTFEALIADWRSLRASAAQPASDTPAPTQDPER